MLHSGQIEIPFLRKRIDFLAIWRNWYERDSRVMPFTYIVLVPFDQAINTINDLEIKEIVAMSAKDRLLVGTHNHYFVIGDTAICFKADSDQIDKLIKSTKIKHKSY